jgi:hypothetical protein
MPQINPATRDAIQPELGPGEEILWASQPSTKVVFHKEDILNFPNGLAMTGFSVFIALIALGLLPADHTENSGNPWIKGLTIAIPLFLAGQYLLWGQYIYFGWMKKRTYYAVTTERAIAVHNSWRNWTASVFMDAIPSLTKQERSDGLGTLLFGDPKSEKKRRRRWIWRMWDRFGVGTLPAFIDVEDVDTVYRLVLDLRAKSKTAKAAY